MGCNCLANQKLGEITPGKVVNPEPGLTKGRRKREAPNSNGYKCAYKTERASWQTGPEHAAGAGQIRVDNRH